MTDPVEVRMLKRLRVETSPGREFQRLRVFVKYQDVGGVDL